MKKIVNLYIAAFLLLGAVGCKKYLDVNTNPNNPTDSSPTIVLPQAIVTTASGINAFDNFGAWTGGYKANAGGYGGWGTVWTYNFTTADYNTMWSNSFGAINQLNFVINNTADTSLKYFNAIARVMKSFVYQKLVDQYGDVPYFDAGKGLNDLTPKYDKYSDVYKAIFNELNAAITILKSASVTNVTVAVSAAQDPIFGGSSLASLAKWIQFANTIKLKMLIRAKNVADLSAWVIASIPSLPATGVSDYSIEDVIVQPGYSGTTASQNNPKWTSYAWDNSGAAVGNGLSNIPTPWILSFYNGTKISDDVRGAAIYASYKGTVSQTINGNTISFAGPATNQLGYDVEPVKRGTNGSYWYSGIGRSSRPTGTTANAATDVGGVLKGATMGSVLLLSAETYFFLAEASLPDVNILPAFAANTKTLFENGITASFSYLYKNAANSYFNTTAASTLKDNYIAANTANPLVNFAMATTPAAQLEAIITQKYIAVNMINSEEGFNEFRRTGYPKISNGSLVATESFASLKSGASATDKLPTRVLYPATEFQVNTENVPKGVNSFTTKIFYAK